jgi:hypothetical protein
MSVGDIADLDEAVAEAGQDITLRRVTGTSQQASFEVKIRAAVRGYRPNEIVNGSGIIQGDRKVIMSPTEMLDRKWPWPPKNGDKAVINGSTVAVQSVNQVVVGGELVRIELQVRG